MFLRINRRAMRDWALLLAGFFVLLFGIGGFFIESRPEIYHLTLSAGSSSGLRHELARELTAQARRAGIRLTLVSTDGSLESLEKVELGAIDLALVQGGLPSYEKTHVRQVLPLHVEPLHLLVKPELAKRIEIDGLEAFEGTTINLSEVGSGTYTLATSLIQFIGSHRVGAENRIRYTASTMSYSDLISEATFELLPDAVFTVSSLPSPVAHALVSQHGYQLVELPFGEAFALDAFRELGLQGRNSVINKRFVLEAVIPAFTYSVTENIPPTAIRTIGTRLLMVSNDRVPDDAVERLVGVLLTSSFAHYTKPQLDVRSLDLTPEFPWHDGAVDYRQHNTPLIAGDVIDFLDKGLAIAATIAGGTFFVIQWYFQNLKRKREQNFQYYLNRVTVIESDALMCEMQSTMDLGRLLKLQEELSKLKLEAVRRFTDGELEGEGLMNGFLALVNDARSHVTRLLLHERDNVEQAAESEGSSLRDAWNRRLETASDEQNTSV